MFTLKILSVEKTVFLGEVHSVTAPGTIGSFQILTDHASMISTLEKGQVKVILPDDTEHTYQITGGVFEVYQNKATILADSVEEG